MPETPKPGPARPAPERFEVFEADPTAHLTAQQKAWRPVQLQPPRGRFEVAAARPQLLLRFRLRRELAEADPTALAADIYSFVLVLSEYDRELGGGGFTLSERRVEPGAVTVALQPVQPDGADERVAKIESLLTEAAGDPPAEPGAALNLLASATESPLRGLKLFLAGSREVTGCEIRNLVA